MLFSLQHTHWFCSDRTIMGKWSDTFYRTSSQILFSLLPWNSIEKNTSNCSSCQMHSSMLIEYPKNSKYTKNVYFSYCLFLLPITMFTVSLKLDNWKIKMERYRFLLVAVCYHDNNKVHRLIIFVLRTRQEQYLSISGLQQQSTFHWLDPSRVYRVKR